MTSNNIEKKNKEYKATYTEAYDGDYPCPNCLIEGKAYEMLEDEMDNKNFQAPVYAESFDPRMKILQQIEGNTGLPTTIHAGTVYAGRLTTLHHFGTLTQIYKEND